MKNKLFVVFILCLFLSGCISSAESTQGLEVKKYDNQERIIHSHQFWNEYPLSIANYTVFNHTGLLDCEIKTFNHAEGNLTVIIEGLEEMSFRNETVSMSFPITANMTMTSYSSGYHDPEIASIGDYFVIDCYLNY